MLVAMTLRRSVSLAVVLMLGALGACSGANVDTTFPGDPGETYSGEPAKDKVNKGSILGGEKGFILFGGPSNRRAAASPIGVNSFLWRASLDTLSFMPLASADPFGGVIITDWYAPPESRGERFKTTVYILSRELRTDGLRVAVFRQLHNGDGTWSDAVVNPATVVDIEDAILTRARELRIASAAG